MRAVRRRCRPWQTFALTQVFHDLGNCLGTSRWGCGPTCAILGRLDCRAEARDPYALRNRARLSVAPKDPSLVRARNPYRTGTRSALRFVLRGECLPRVAPNVIHVGSQAFLLTFPSVWSDQLQVVSHTQNHDRSSQSKLLKQAIWDAHTTRAVHRHPCRFGENCAFKVLHSWIAEQRSTKARRKLEERFLRPEPEALVLSRRRHESLSVDFVVQHLTQFRWNGEALLLVESVLVFADEKQRMGVLWRHATL